MAGTANINDFTIYLTEKCNLSCTYCYYQKDFAKSLDPEILQKSIRWFFGNVRADQTAYITILGGEPFLEKNLIFRAIEMIDKQRRDAKVKILLFTNGTILNKEDVKQLVASNVDIYLSLDGIRESNDAYRGFRSSDSSVFDTIMKNLGQLFPGDRERIHVNMVVGPDNCAHLMENIRFLNSLGFQSIDINLMSYLQWPKQSLKVLIAQLDLVYKYYLSLFTEHVDRPFKMYQLDQLLHGGWGKMDQCRRLKIAPDGNFYFCDAFFSLPSNQKEKYKIGDTSQGYSVEKMEELKAEAKEAISTIVPKTFLLHAQNRMLYCPYGVYYYSKLHNHELRQSLQNFYLFSRIFSSFLWHLFEALKRNKDFLDFYNREDHFYRCKTLQAQ